MSSVGTPTWRPLPRSFYLQDTLEVAQQLLGLHLVSVGPEGSQIARIVETEAYCGPEDRAAHSSRKRSARTEVMFGPPGHAYVYLIYGFWNCLNLVTAPEEVPHAVLLRAVEPLAGISQTTHGPGLLCRALGIDRSLNRHDFTQAQAGSPHRQFWIERPRARAARPVQLASSPRIGVDYAGEWAQKPWRFFDQSSPFISGLSPAQRRKLQADWQPPSI